MSDVQDDGFLRDKLADLFDRQKRLAQSVAELFPGLKDTSYEGLAEHMLGLETVRAIEVMTAATGKELRRLPGPPDPSREPLWLDAKDIVGWLCLPVVDPASRDKIRNVGLSLGSLFAIETAVAADRSRPANYCVKDGRVASPHALEVPPKHRMRDPDELYEELLVDLWNMLYPRALVGRSALGAFVPLDEHQKKALKSKIGAMERQAKRNGSGSQEDDGPSKYYFYYLIIDGSDDWREMSDILHAKFVADEIYLTVVRVNDPGGASAIQPGVDQGALETAVRKFLELERLVVSVGG